MKKNLRVKTSKFIDETYKISFKFNGTTYYGYKGDTLASALLANDEPHKLNAAFNLNRFVSGDLVDEHGAAAVAH